MNAKLQYYEADAHILIKIKHVNKVYFNNKIKLRFSM